MAYPGRFAEQLLGDRLDRISLSFLADTLDIRRGGVGANIALGLARLGLRPVLAAAAGRDFAEYGAWLRANGVDTGAVRVSDTLHTARFVCTTDADQNQIATFHAGAMAEARHIGLARTADRHGPFALAVIGPDDPEAMLRHAEECRRLGIPFAADPSQQLARLDRTRTRHLIDGARLLFTNEYEAGLLLRHTAWTREQVLERTGAWVVTRGAPRATVVALHGGGVHAGYFDGQAHPDLSLLTLGTRLGFTVLAVDRPGYGHSAARLPEGLPLAAQSAVLGAALADFTAGHPVGAGLFLLGHSLGGKLALLAAADGPPLLGVDVSGCGHRPAAGPAAPDRAARAWGPLGLYPPGTFRPDADLFRPIPPREAADIPHWPRLFTRIAPRVRVPVRFTFAEHERWWCHGDRDLADLRARFTGAPRVLTERQPSAGHNISLGWAARSYHLRALAFLEDCVTRLAGR
ncbi:PfkB family carbohydrate kinase [Streptomyces sp. NPDC006134]|uniref:PfkB family carbohydrate kinase n=1 Tax=Streptomyces sp. NPDC006134 TaxID=3154467 RepID=UPI0033EA6A5E